MNVVGVFGEHVVIVDEFLRIRSRSRDADESKLANDFFDVFILPQSGSAERLQQIRATQQFQLHIGFCGGQIADNDSLWSLIKRQGWRNSNQKFLYHQVVGATTHSTQDFQQT